MENINYNELYVKLTDVVGMKVQMRVINQILYQLPSWTLHRAEEVMSHFQMRNCSCFMTSHFPSRLCLTLN